MEVDCSSDEANSNTETILLKPKAAASEKNPESPAWVKQDTKATTSEENPATGANEMENPEASDSKEITETLVSEMQKLKTGASEQGSLKTVVREKENEPMELTEQQGNSDCHENPNQGAIKKKRGRPKLNCNSIKTREAKQPVRKSQRTKKAPEVISYSHMSKMTREMWSEEDNLQLLRGLEEFGHENPENLRKYLPHRRTTEIATQIRMWQDLAHNDVQKRLATEKRKGNSATVNTINKLDEWIKHFKSNFDADSPRLFALSHVFLLISEYADFPSPDECGGIDFRAMYRFIHSAINGMPFYGVNTATAQILKQSIADMFQTFRDQNIVKEMQDILIEETKPTIKHCTYSRKETFESGSSDAIWNFPDVNPLNLPAKSCEKTWKPEQYNLSDIISDEDDEEEGLEVVDLSDTSVSTC